MIRVMIERQVQGLLDRKSSCHAHPARVFTTSARQRKESAMAKIRRRTTMLTVDAGPEHREPARFYRLMVAARGSDTVREDLLVPDGDELRTTHTHETLPDAA
jgi:hypothetical protein